MNSIVFVCFLNFKPESTDKVGAAYWHGYGDGRRD